MFKRIKRWLGWQGDSSWLVFGELTGPKRSQPNPTPKAGRPPVAVPTGAAARAQPPLTEHQKKPREPLEVLDNPKLSLDKPADDGFDPYNTGAFNRSTSWEKIGRQRKG